MGKKGILFKVGFEIFPINKHNNNVPKTVFSLVN